MAYISLATADYFVGGYSLWLRLNNVEKTSYIESASVRFDKLVFKTDNEKTLWPRFKYVDSTANRAAKGRLAQITSMTALWYAERYQYSEDRHRAGLSVPGGLDRLIGYLDSSSRWEIRDQDVETISKVGPIDTAKKYKYGHITFFDLVEDAQDLPISIQSQLVRYCKFLTPRGKKLSGGVARPLVYVD